MSGVKAIWMGVGGRTSRCEREFWHRFGAPLDSGTAGMAIGAHVLYTSEPDAVRSVLRDLLGWRHVEAGAGWLIFALPPAEVGVHPAEGPT